jgi:hypothetical protein
MAMLIRRAARFGLALLVACAVLVAGAWAGGGLHAARAGLGSRPRIRAGDSYPARSAAGEIPIGDALSVAGQSMQLSAFTTVDAPARVVDFYVDAFSRRGLIPVAFADDRLGHVSVFDPRDRLQHFVTAVPEQPGHTLVLAGAVDPRGFRFDSSAKAAPYPIPDDNRAFLGFASEDGNARAHSGQFVSNLPVAEVTEFYRAALAARGFSERHETGPALLEFAKGTEHMSVALQSLGSERGAAVFVTHVDGAP